MGGPRITNEQKLRMRTLAEQGKSYSEIASLLGVSAYAVRSYTGDIVRVATKPQLSDGELLVDIDGYEGLYQVSSHGRVFTLKAADAPRPIKLHQSKKAGYKVTLTKDGKTRLLRLDELVASKFCDKRPNNAVVVHLDGNLFNSKSDNLAWTEPAAKMPPKRGRMPRKRGRLRKLDDKDVMQVRSRWLAGEEPAQIAKDYNVSTTTVYKELDGLIRDIPEPPSEDGEIWKHVVGCENAYMISSHGRVYSTGRGRRSARIMAPSVNSGGCKSICLIDDDGGHTTYFVHRLVAMAFCDGYDDEHNIVNHVDGNSSNNNADNLEWCTPQENTQHAITVLGKRMGGSKPFINRSVRETDQSSCRVSPLRRFTPEQVQQIRTDPRSARQLAREYGVNKCTITDIRRGFTYRELP